MRTGNRFPGRLRTLTSALLGFFARLGLFPGERHTSRIKFVGYQELLELLTKPECPACAIVNRSIESFLSVSFVEQLSMKEFRDPLRASLGYCKPHSAYVRAAARNWLKAMGIAVVYEDLLGLVQDSLRTRQRVPTVSGCPLCILQRDLEGYALQLIADYCDDREFQQAYALSSGVCLPHLDGLLRLLGDRARAFIIDSHEKKIERQLAHLEQFIRKQDYRFSHEKLTASEAVSWKTAVTMMVGQ